MTNTSILLPPRRADVYTRITNTIVAALEQGVRPWLKPWSVEHAAGRITRPLRHKSVPYNGINVLMLGAEAADKGFITIYINKELTVAR